jgi:hypothetical protein
MNVASRTHAKGSAMFSVCLRQANHVRQYFVSNRSAGGWEIRSEEDHTLRKHVWYHDWHRVERTLELFRREVAELTAQGWQIQPTKQ